MASASVPARGLVVPPPAPESGLAVPPPAASTAEVVDLSARGAICEDPRPVFAAAAFAAADAAATAHAASTTGFLSGLTVLQWVWMGVKMRRKSVVSSDPNFSKSGLLFVLGVSPQDKFSGTSRSNFKFGTRGPDPPVRPAEYRHESCLRA